MYLYHSLPFINLFSGFAVVTGGLNQQTTCQH